jgi:hypothetical protein
MILAPMVRVAGDRTAAACSRGRPACRVGHVPGRGGPGPGACTSDGTQASHAGAARIAGVYRTSSSKSGTPWHCRASCGTVTSSCRWPQ